MRHKTISTTAALTAALLTGGLLSAAPAGAVSSSTASTAGYEFTVKLSTATQSCSGALIAPSVVITDGLGCFNDNGNGGTPHNPITAIVGRTDLSGTTGHVVPVSNLTINPFEGFWLARLATPVTDVTPLRLASTPPVTGEALRVAGWGRTSDEWVPNQLHTAGFRVTSSNADVISLTGDNGADTCKGDAGAPAIRTDSGGGLWLAGISTSSKQHGCLGETGTEQGTGEVRTDTQVGWIRQQILAPTAKAVGHTITASWNALAASDNADYRVYGSATDPQVAITPANLLTTTKSTSYTQTGVPGNQDRYFRVVPVTADGVTNTPTGVFGAKTKASAGNDFTGDGKDDIGAGFAVGASTAGAYVWPTTADGGVGAPALKWSSDGWNPAQARWVSGDFNGDGRTDFGAFYDYQNNSANFFVWNTNASGGFDFQGIKWNGAFSPLKAKFVTADFDGDGRTDVGGAYDNGSARMTFLTWHATSDGGFDAPVTKIDSGNGNWNTGQSYWVAGDFNGDGKGDVAAFYDYLDNTSNLFVYYGNASGGLTGGDTGIKWNGALTATKSQFIAGDFDGDGRTDIAVPSDLGNANLQMRTWHATATGFDAPVTQWTTGAGQWNLSQSRWTKGDFDGDGRTDLVASYYYGNFNTNLFFWHANATGGFDGQGIKWSSNAFNASASTML